MTIFVTGGAGFIGSELVRQLVFAGERVVTIDKLTYAGRLDNLSEVLDQPNHRFVRADIADVGAMLQLFRAERPTIVYHLAAESHVDRSIDAPMAFIDTNIRGGAILLLAALEYWQALRDNDKPQFRFLLVSTDEVYGELGRQGLFSETSPYQPKSPYAASKAAADHLARAWHRTYGLPVLISNCSNNYGPRQFPEKLIPLMILNALENKPLPVYGQGLQIRDWLHVQDHAAALQRIADDGRPGETYLIGARNEWRNLDLVNELCIELDRQHPAGAPHRRLIEFVTDRPGHDARYAIDPTKIEHELGWRPIVDFATGLNDTVSWYRANRNWCARTKLSYGRQRLGIAQA